MDPPADSDGRCGWLRPVEQGTRGGIETPSCGIRFSRSEAQRLAQQSVCNFDLWVNIPGGFENNRINTAYSLGEQYKVPGGGPAQAMATVESLLGVPVDYYALVDFNAFIRFIDELGGVKIDIPARIQVDPLGDNNTRTLKPGVQVLTGELALAYAGNRKTEGGDFDRAQRQQQVILAIRNQLIRPRMLPELIAKAPILYNELASGIKTNLTLEQVIKLAWMAQQIEVEDIQRGVIWRRAPGAQQSSKHLRAPSSK